MFLVNDGMRVPNNCVDCKLYADDGMQCPFCTIYKGDYWSNRFEKCPIIALPEPYIKPCDDCMEFDCYDCRFKEVK